MRTPLHWTALLLGILAVAPVAAEAALRLYVSYVTKPARLFRSDAQTGWSNAPNLLTTLINAAGFLALSFSTFPPLRQFGLMTSSAFLLALLADFTALPAGLWIVERRRAREI